MTTNIAKTLWYIILLIVMITILGYFITKIVVEKDDEIIKENKEYIYVKNYSSNLSLLKSNGKFGLNVTYDITYWKYKQKEIIYEGKVVDSSHGNHSAVIIDKKTKKKLNLPDELLNCDQVNMLQDNRGKNIQVYKQYYPKNNITIKLVK